MSRDIVQARLDAGEIPLAVKPLPPGARLDGESFVRRGASLGFPAHRWVRMYVVGASYNSDGTVKVPAELWFFA